jgi:3-methyladenine DNA glycosylase/8-oxoguanine DNA glycosylase
MLGLDSDAAAFERQFSGDPLLGAIVSRQRGLRIPLTPAPWEALAWAIMGQQISVKAAVALRRELIGALGQEHVSGLRAHPTPEDVAGAGADALRKLKFSGSKAEYLVAAARGIAENQVPLDALRQMSARHAARLLGGIRGVGPWTVQYTFLRGLGFADCLPAGDAGLAQALERLTAERPGEAAIREMLGKFAPYRSLASYHLWASLKVWATLKGGGNDAT